MRKYFLLLLLAVVPALAIAQSEKTNKGSHYLEVKTGLSISDVTSDMSLAKGFGFDMRYAYGLIENLDVIAAYTSGSGYKSVFGYADNSYIDEMYYGNAFQVGIRGKVKCFDFMNLKLSLTAGMINCAMTRYSYIESYIPYTEMYFKPCVGGMLEVDFDISERMSLGLFFGRNSSMLNKNIGVVTFDNTGLSLSVKL